jgi:hypothetical protein
MTAVNTGLSPAQVQGLIISALQQHRNALALIQNIYKWTSGLAAADFATASGLSSSDAVAYLSAIADGNAEANLHYTGQPGGSYPAPVADYIYSATQAQVIGPQ